MIAYHNGTPIRLKEKQSLVEWLVEHNIPLERMETAINNSLSSDNACCDRLWALDPFIEPDIDIGTMEILSFSVLMPDEYKSRTEDTVLSEIGHEWVHWNYCPFCGKSLKRKIE